MTPVRLAILGVSGIASGYVKVARALPGVTLEAVWGRDAARTRAFAARHAIPRAETELSAILASPTIDGVLILTEPARHIELATLALEHDKPMLIEKPLGMELTACRAFVARAQASDLPIGVVSPYRFNPLLAGIKADLDRIDPEAPKIAQLTLFWPRDEAYYRHGDGWRSRDGAVLVNQGIHWIDTLNWFFGHPERVEACSWPSRPFLSGADAGAVLLAYPRHATVLIAAGTFAPEREDQLVIHHPGGRIDYAALRGPPAPRHFRERLGRWLLGGPVWGRALPDMMALQLADFVSALRERRPPAVTLADGLSALEVALAASLPSRLPESATAPA
ncbi:scyllo-inositol 2-dehydrogenase (NADP(+)) IolU [Candidatus Magnetaquicoccaceae bacterium FCR-1]|uniref:Scyllo-inositol 2-dehydrogenase (NADP(+)) IolU n=1 Tax=Candidatus Magnetaquiglobus chichijimensis TaxID=3141448 RepID=A0ABQ0CAQ0_9PROT